MFFLACLIHPSMLQIKIVKGQFTIWYGKHVKTLRWRYNLEVVWHDISCRTQRWKVKHVTTMFQVYVIKTFRLIVLIDHYQHMVRCEVPWSTSSVREACPQHRKEQHLREMAEVLPPWNMMYNPSKPMADHFSTWRIPRKSQTLSLARGSLWIIAPMVL